MTLNRRPAVACQQRVSKIRRNASILVGVRGAVLAWLSRLSSVGQSRLTRGQARQAGGRWFEPSTAHLRRPALAGPFSAGARGERVAAGRDWVRFVNRVISELSNLST